MDQPTKPRRPKRVLTQDEQDKREFERRVTEIERAMNQALNTPHMQELIEEAFETGKKRKAEK